MSTSRIFSSLSIALLLSVNIAHAETPLLDKSANISRADFVKLIIDRLYTKDEMETCFQALSPSKYRLLFSDVSVDAQYARELCMAMKTGMVRGYQDGTFRPDQTINFAEASKIYTRAFSLSPAAGLGNYVPWYRGYVETLASRGAIPNNVKSLSQPMTYLTHEEILRRITNDVTYLDSQTYLSLGGK